MKIETGSRLNSEHFSELAQSLLASPEVAARATLLTDAVRKSLPDSACALYSLRPSFGWSLLDYPRRIRRDFGGQPVHRGHRTTLRSAAGIAAPHRLFRQPGWPAKTTPTFT